MSMSRHFPVQGAYNIRDLGGYKSALGIAIPWRRFLRSDSLHRLADGEIDRLHAFGVRKVIDLRTPDELAQAPNPFASYHNVQFANVPLFDDLSPEALSKTRSPDDDPLVAFYMAAIDTRGSAICAIMAEIAGVEQGAVLFNCTAGKDRTGIIAALLLGLADVPHDQIVEDYTLTADLITDLVAEFLEISRSRGGDTESYAKLLQSPGPTMASTLAQIQAKYGSISEYLEVIGLPLSDVEKLRARLLKP